MVFAFPLTAIVTILSLSAMIVNLLVYIVTDMIPFWVSMGITAVLFGICLGMIFLSLRLYYRSFRKCDTDLEGFLKEQNRIAGKVRGNLRSAVKQNMLLSLICYEKYEDAFRMLVEIGNEISPENIMGRLNYLRQLAVIDIGRRKFDRVDHYVDEMQKLIPILAQKKIRGIADPQAFWKYYTDSILVIAEFYSRTPEMLSGADRQYTENMLANLEKTYQLQKQSRIEYHYPEAAYLARMGMVYVLLGEQEKGTELIRSAAALPYQYPVIQHAGQYLETGDIRVLM